MNDKDSSFVVCLCNEGYLASLEPRKIYRRLRDSKIEADGDMRVIDESGEDYIYPARFFEPIDLPQTVQRVVLAH
jgi:hypothetical protein